jgi:hypothetical protein
MASNHILIVEAILGMGIAWAVVTMLRFIADSI